MDWRRAPPRSRRLVDAVSRRFPQPYAGCAAGAIHDDAGLCGPEFLENRVHMTLDEVVSSREPTKSVPRRGTEAACVEHVFNLPLLILIEGHAVGIP